MNISNAINTVSVSGSSSSSAKKTSEKNKWKLTDSLKEKIVEYLVDTGNGLTVSELMKEVEELKELSNQRVTSLVTSLCSEGKVDRMVEKRKAYFFAK